MQTNARCSIFFVFLLSTCLGVSGQVRDASEPSTAASVSAWRHTAKALLDSQHDSVDPSTRAIRDQMLDEMIGAKLPIDTPAGRLFHFGSERVGSGPEIPTNADMVALVRFTGYQPVLSSSRRSLYTEINLSPERVFKSSVTISPSSAITLIVPGGTALTDSGEISFGTLDSQFQLQPGHRYVVFLRHVPQGDFYLMDKSWELRGGVLIPNSADDLMRFNERTSLYAGMPESDFLAKLPSLLGK